MENFKKIKNNNLKFEKDKTDYKKRYYWLIREMSRLQSEMCDRCPVVKNCCGGCRMLKSKINYIKKQDKNGN